MGDRPFAFSKRPHGGYWVRITQGVYAHPTPIGIVTRMGASMNWVGWLGRPGDPKPIRAKVLWSTRNAAAERLVQVATGAVTYTDKETDNRG